MNDTIHKHNATIKKKILTNSKNDQEFEKTKQKSFQLVCRACRNESIDI